jgi:hypothetical protein
MHKASTLANKKGSNETPCAVSIFPTVESYPAPLLSQALTLHSSSNSNGMNIRMRQLMVMLISPVIDARWKANFVLHTATGGWITQGTALPTAVKPVELSGNYNQSPDVES